MKIRTIVGLLLVFVLVLGSTGIGAAGGGQNTKCNGDGGFDGDWKNEGEDPHQFDGTNQGGDFGKYGEKYSIEN